MRLDDFENQRSEMLPQPTWEQSRAQAQADISPPWRWWLFAAGFVMGLMGYWVVTTGVGACP